MRDISHRSLELQPEIDRRIDECSDRSKRNGELGGDLVEAQPHRKSRFIHFQVPELVLQNDRHLVGEALAQAGRDRNAWRTGLEGDVEMMAARQIAARAFDLAEHRSAERRVGTACVSTCRIRWWR